MRSGLYHRNNGRMKHFASFLGTFVCVCLCLRVRALSHYLLSRGLEVGTCAPSGCAIFSRLPSRQLLQGKSQSHLDHDLSCRVVVPCRTGSSEEGIQLQVSIVQSLNRRLSRVCPGQVRRESGTLSSLLTPWRRFRTPRPSPAGGPQTMIASASQCRLLCAPRRGRRHVRSHCRCPHLSAVAKLHG